MRIGVLRGGVSPEYDISIKSGGRVLSALHDMGGEVVPIDMFITKDGTFHVQGVERDIEEIPDIVDAVFIALHGALGEDGRVQEILENLNVPFNGTSSKAIGRTHSKLETKNIARTLGVKVPDSYVLRGADLVPESMREGYAEEAARETWSHIAPPWVVKPTHGGSSKHTYYAGTFSELVEAIYNALGASSDLLVETYVPGREVHLFVANNFRNEPIYVSPALEIFHGKKILGENERNSGEYQGVFAKDSDSELFNDLNKIAKKLFDEFGLSGYATMDFIITPRGIVLLEIDALPALDENSPLSKILDEIGAPISYLIEQSLS